MGSDLMVLLFALFKFSQQKMRTGWPRIFIITIMAMQLGKWLNLLNNTITIDKQNNNDNNEQYFEQHLNGGQIRNNN